jgi:hypothetical protein
LENKFLKPPFILKRVDILQTVYAIFLISNILPFFIRNQYEIITKLNYSLTLLVLLGLTTLPRNVYKQFYLYILLIFSIGLVVLGNSGSIFALIACTIFPIILFYNFKKREDLFVFFYPPIITVSVFSIIAVLYVFLNTYNILTEFYFLGEYFVIASINYVPLTLFNIATLLYLILQVNYFQKNIAISKVILFVLTLLCVVASFIYLTKTTLFGSFLLLFLQLNRKYLLFILGILVFVLLKYQELFLDAFMAFMGAEQNELTMNDDRRVDSAVLYVTDAIKFKFNYRDTQSFSTLLNLLFSIFPFSLLMVFPLIYVIRKFDFKIINQYALFGVTLLLTVYQMDFMSIFNLYFITQIISYSNKYSIFNE